MQAPTETGAMVVEALKAMAIGIPVVFLVLSIFYVSIRVMMSSANKKKDEA